MENQEQIKRIEQMAATIRRDILEMTRHAGPAGSHIGGALSCADVLAVLYGSVMNIRPETAAAPERDRFLLSKGHSSVGWYAALHQSGFLTDEDIASFESNGGFLPAHSVMNVEKGIELSSGSLGLGLSFGIGEALNARKRGMDYRVYVLMGNGECNEGCVWEAVMLAAKRKLDNLFMIVDDNKQQLDGASEAMPGACDLAGTLEKFGFETYRADGHRVGELLEVFGRAGKKNAPVAIVMDTVKGKGISFMENDARWHHSRLTQEEYEQAVKEIEADD